MDKRDLGQKPEIRTDENGNKFAEGYAIVFNSRSKNLGGFFEVVEPNAMNSDTDTSDIMGRYNHTDLIGRSTSGTLTYIIDNVGVKYSISIPDTTVGRDLEVMLERRDVTGSSFAFDIRKKGDAWEELEDGMMLRTISSFSKIYDMGPVDNPAYDETTSAVRSLEKFSKEKVNSELLEKRKLDRASELRKLELIELEILEK